MTLIQKVIYESDVWPEDIEFEPDESEEEFDALCEIFEGFVWPDFYVPYPKRYAEMQKAYREFCELLHDATPKPEIKIGLLDLLATSGYIEIESPEVHFMSCSKFLKVTESADSFDIGTLVSNKLSISFSYDKVAEPFYLINTENEE